MEIQYNLMDINDYDEIIKLWSETPGIGISISDQKERLGGFLNKNKNTCFTVKINGKIAATALCGNDGRRGYLYHLAVIEEYRNKGIAKELVNKCFEGLKAEGIHLCHLFVFKTNETAVKFYKKTNWREREEIVVYSKDTDK